MSTLGLPPTEDIPKYAAAVSRIERDQPFHADIHGHYSLMR
jgi:hypothetical protein